MRKTSLDKKYGTNDADDDVRENIISYDDEGGGEDDMQAFDITPLRIPIDPNGTLISNRGKQNIFQQQKPTGILKDLRKGPGSNYETGNSNYGTLQSARYPGGPGQFIEPTNLRLMGDEDAATAHKTVDDLRNYAYEGCGSTAGSLSSLASLGRADDELQDFDYLNRWGPQFQKLANLYGQEPRKDQ